MITLLFLSWVTYILTGLVLNLPIIVWLVWTSTEWRRRRYP